MNRPWLQLYTRDWLDDIPLRSCSPASRGVLADLMCIAHECSPYGYLARDGEALPEDLMYGRMRVRRAAFRKSLEELHRYGRLSRTVEGIWFIPRMVRDEEVRIKRALGGHASTKNPNTHPKKRKEGYPSDHPPDPNGGGGEPRAGARRRALRALPSALCLSESSPEGGSVEGGGDHAKHWRDKAFEDFWEIVWFKKGKGAAETAFKKQAKTESLAAKIISAAEAQGAEIVRDAEANKHSVLHPSTWLNGQRYRDEGTKLKPAPPDPNVRPDWLDGNDGVT